MWKKITLIIILLIFCSLRNVYAENHYISFEKCNIDSVKTLHIIDIEKTKNAYYIQVVYEQRCYTIVSLIINDEEDCETIIEEGKEYQFVTSTYFEDDMIPWNISYEIVIKGIKLEVPMDKGMNIFFTPNLNGLCYTSPIN